MPRHSQPPVPHRTGQAPPPETIDPGWLAKAFALVLAVACLFGYGALCLLFYQGQWQLVLHPGGHALSSPPAGAEIVRFGPDATATPQLTGWWIPADPDAQYRGLTLLYLRGGDGTLNDDGATLSLLHRTGLNLLAFNYRGYPASPKKRPSQQSMTEDAEAAWQYLVSDRHLVPGSIVPYGSGVGGFLAVRLAVEHRDVQALVLDDPRGDLLDVALRSPQGALLPVHLLFNQRFPIAAALSTLSTPKLIVDRAVTEPGLSRRAADPKFTVELPPGSSPASLTVSLSRFLDQYLRSVPLAGNLPRLPLPDQPASKPLK